LIVWEGHLYNNQLVVGNRLLVDESTLLKNLWVVQESKKLPVSEGLSGMNFSAEMEMGTGKTYVYLQTIYELYRRAYFVAETKGTTRLDELKPAEQQKIRCERKHYENFEGVTFAAPVTKLKDLRV
jgi:restriction endonuclease